MGVPLESKTARRVAKNSLALYLRQIVVLFVSLYSLRILLESLGVEDYGVYAVVSGMVAMVGFLSATLASATQRFFSFALGQNDSKQLKTLFTVNLVLYVGVAFIGFAVLESIGLWYVTEYLVIPEKRFAAALELYHCTVIVFVAGVVITPFISIIVAHEDMKLYAYVSIVEVLLKLFIVVFLLYYDGDVLSMYGLLLLVLSIFVALIYLSICLLRYSECQLKKMFWSFSIFKEVIGFTGWTLFGALSTVTRNQAVTILLNQFFGPATAAARAISNSISTQVLTFSNNFNVGLYPPIIKKYSSGEHEQMLALVLGGSKLTFFLVWVLALPLILQMNFILELWLRNVPDETALFARLALVEMVVHSITMPVATAVRAPGKMRLYELTLGSMQMLVLVFAWLALKNGAPAVSVYIVAIVVNVLMMIVRLLIAHRLLALSMMLFFRFVILPVLLVASLSSTFSYFLYSQLPSGYLGLLVSVAGCAISSSCCMYYFGLDRNWRTKIRAFAVSRLHRINVGRI